jgi:xanthine dehydrogenase accessory factor
MDVDVELIRLCGELLEAGTDLVMVTVIKASPGTPGKEGFKLLVTDDGRQHGTVGGGAIEHQAVREARQLLASRESRVADYDLRSLGMKCGGKATLVFEYLPGRRGFVLFGGGHVGRALAPILESLGFRVTIFDDRPEVRALLPETPARRLLIGSYMDISPVTAALTEDGFCFIATHGHEHDYAVLRQLLRLGKALRYIGLIGSRSKVRATLKRLGEEGLEAPGSLYAPVGLPIGGDTAAAIAVSVAAEVVAVLSAAKVPHMRERSGEESPSR